MANIYKHHLIVIPEDDKYNNIVNGIVLSSNVDENIFNIFRPSGGWLKVFEQLEDQMKHLERLKYRHILILIDFDEKFESRYKMFFDEVPSEYLDRVFILGVNNKEFEDLQRFFSLSNFEKLAKKLVENCPDSDLSNWKNKYLECNLAEIGRMKDLGVFDWLFKK